MLAIGETASGHRATGEFVDDHHFAIADHVVLVPGEKLVRLQSVVDVMDDSHIFHIIERT